jgi:hypothetical protein
MRAMFDDKQLSAVHVDECQAVCRLVGALPRFRHDLSSERFPDHPLSVFRRLT